MFMICFFVLVNVTKMGNKAAHFLQGSATTIELNNNRRKKMIPPLILEPIAPGTPPYFKNYLNTLKSVFAEIFIDTL